MSEDNKATTAEAVKEEVRVLKTIAEGELVIKDKDGNVQQDKTGLKICLGEYETDAKDPSKTPTGGLKYCYPQVESGSHADKCYGAEEVAGIINAALKAKIALKAKTNALPRNVDQPTMTAWLVKAANTVVDGIQGLIFDSSKAADWNPGDRVPGVEKQIKLELTKVLELYKAGKLTPAEQEAFFAHVSALQPVKKAA